VHGRPLLVVLAVCGCGRVNFDPIDAGVVDASCWPAWRNHNVRLTAPEPLAALVTANTELDPTVGRDDRTLYFVRGPSGARDVFMSTRPDRAAAFEPEILRADISSAQDDGKLSLDDDELSLVISSDRTGSQAYDLWQLSRATTAEPFSSATQAPFAQVNATSNERDPHLSGDGLTLHFAYTVLGGQQILVATRASASAPFSPPMMVTGLDLAVTADPELSPDGLVILYTAAPDTMTPTQLYYATRTAPSGPFENPEPVPDVSAGSVGDGDANLTRDGCELFFSSSRAGGRDLYRAAVLR
jgi:hypothetical protein